MRKMIVLAVAFLVLGCEGKAGPMGPQGEAGARGATGSRGSTGSAGNVEAFDLISFDIIRALYTDDGQGFIIEDSRIAPDTFIGLYVAGADVTAYIELSSLHPDAVYLIAEGLIVIFDPIDSLLGETLVVAVLP